MDELRPHVDEYHRLEAAAKALAGAAGTPPSGRRTRTIPQRSGGRRGGGRPRGPPPGRSTRPIPQRSGGRRGGGRPRGSGTRGTQALDIVREQPGITIPEIAEKMGIQQNSLYRVLRGLAQDGRVDKQRRGWHPKTAA